MMKRKTIKDAKVNDKVWVLEEEYPFTPKIHEGVLLENGKDCVVSIHYKQFFRKYDGELTLKGYDNGSNKVLCEYVKMQNQDEFYFYRSQKCELFWFNQEKLYVFFDLKDLKEYLESLADEARSFERNTRKVTDEVDIMIMDSEDDWEEM